MLANDCCFERLGEEGRLAETRMAEKTTAIDKNASIIRI
jgi:hypothetical protein